MDGLFLVMPIAYMVFVVAGLIMEKGLRAKYNGAVGLLNSFLFTGGLLGGIMMIIMMFMDSVTVENPAEIIISALVCLAVAAVLPFVALKKCPAGNKSILGLMGAMLLVGAAASMRIFGFLMKRVFRLDLFAGRAPGVGYARTYRDQEGGECKLWTANGSYAVLKGPDGRTFDVRPHGTDGLVCDDSNRLYYPL